MHIVVDQAIPWAQDALCGFGRVSLMPAAAITPAVVRNATALIVRSVTQVGADLLESTAVSLVATATAGVDHVDQQWLAAHNIRFFSAAGCNATAVAQYVMTALHIVALKQDPGLLRGPIGVVGFGQVGRRVATILRSLGAEVLVCDPPLQRLQLRGALQPTDAWSAIACRETFMPLADVLANSRVVTLHVPLQYGGPDVTLRLLDAAALDLLPRGALLIHTCRGGVVDESALRHWFDHSAGHAIIDVWANEPHIDFDLVTHPQVHLATPHIAGYTLEGKLRATSMVADALSSALNVPARWDHSSITGDPVAIPIPPFCGSPLVPCTELLRRVNPIERDDSNLDGLRVLADHGAMFERLRSQYDYRREFDHFAPRTADAGLANTLTALGFSHRCGQPI